MSRGRVQRRLAAILASDVVGYSRLMGDDEAGTLTALKELRSRLIDPTIARYNGRIVKLTGDGTLVEFASVVDAVECAVELQTSISGRNAEEGNGPPIQLRIGINLGDVIVDGDDIYGDGVNVAARLESEAPPDGILISDMAHAQVRGKVGDGFVRAGKLTLKNIEAPVEAWRWVPGQAPKAPSARFRPDERDRPSIAVLPLNNMSGDPEQEYFADGITEDIITELSRYPELFVIARNSTFTFKGRAVNVTEVGRDLGAHYVVEGSVRKSGSRVRVTVQLIDALTGTHLWAERYDRELADIFAIQDELSRSIVATLPGRIWPAEERRLRRKPPQHMAAYDYMLAGRIHHHRVTREDNAEAVRLLDKAIELDSRFAEAFAWKACTLGQSLEFGFADEPANVEEQAIEAVNLALGLDEHNVECHRLLCEVCMECHELEQAAVHNERALAMNPNDPRIVAQKGEMLTWLGRSDEAVDWIGKAMQLDPYGAPARSHLLGRALYCRGAYREAAAAYRQKPSPRYAHLADLAACHARLGEIEAATERAKAVLASKPDFTISGYLALLPFADPTDRDRLAEGLRKAGLPE